MYKVYILNEKIELSELPFSDEPTSGAVVFDQKGLDPTKMLKILQKNNSLERLSRSEAKKTDLKEHSLLWLVEAAGGVVRRGEDILMIFRNGVWDLPKGKLEKGEKIADCALREVGEECGINLADLERGELITQTLHAYTMYGKDVLKRTWWYEMNYSGSGELTPQGVEGITQARWLDKQQAQRATDESYGTIADVMNTYKALKNK